MCILCNLISEAKDGNKNSMLEILNKFKPLIKKYSYKMNYEDAENDLILSMIQLIYDMPYLNNDGHAVNYINQSIYNAYIKYIKLQIKNGRMNTCTTQKKSKIYQCYMMVFLRQM